MEWIERLNQAISYIDKHLDGSIDYDEISRITVSPIALFQRFFMLATNTTLAEYIRRRRLTSALIDLQSSKVKVVDVALKYGYDSSDAFCTAFKRLYGMTPSQVRKTDQQLKHYDRIFFTLTITYIKGEKDMVLLNVDKYRYYDPLFEGVRIILSYIGEKYTPEYVLGISGSAFKIAGGCPSRPTCVCDFWPADFFQYLGYEVTEYPCFDENENDITDKMIDAVKRQIDSGKPALVWHAFTNEEWDVVCGYDDDLKQFLGRGTLKGNDDYAREPWDRAKTSGIMAFGAITVDRKTSELNQREAEIQSLIKAVQHARTETDDGIEGIQFYKKWGALYSAKGAERDLADAYCYDTYSSVRKAAIIYLRDISYHYDTAAMECLQKAAACFEREAALLASAKPYLSWESPWGVDEERSKKLAPILAEAAGHYEEGIGYIETALAKIG